MHQAILTLFKALILAPAIPSRRSIKPVAPWPEAIADDVARVMPSLQSLVFKEAQSGPRVHAETVISDLGALAGYAAQHAVREDLKRSGVPPLYVPEVLLDRYLAPHGETALPTSEPPHSLYALVAAAVVAEGTTPIQDEDFTAIVGRNAEAMGTPAFGVPNLLRHNQPHHLPREALYRLWPEIVPVLGQRPLYGPGKAIDPAYWPTILGVLAQRLIPQMTGVLHPTLAMRVFFEAAIPMSRIDLASVLGADR